MKNIYKPLFLGISLVLAVNSNVANAKHASAKHELKQSSHKQHANQKSSKAAKDTAKQVAGKQHSPKIIQAHITKPNSVNYQKSSSALSKENKSATRQALAKHQEQAHKLTQSAKLPEADATRDSETEEVASSQNTDTTELNNGVTIYNGEATSESAAYTQFPAFKNHRTTFYKIKGGDTIASIFENLKLNDKIIRNRKINRQFRSLIPGKILSINTNARGELTSLAYKSNRFNDLMNSSTNHEEGNQNLTGNAETFSSETPSSRTLGQIKHVSTHVIVQSSLEQASKNAGLPKKITKQLTDIFAWDIDFSQNLRPNDQFTVVYEKIFENGRAIDTGDVVAAEFINQGESHQAVRYKDNNGFMNYYTPEGEGMRRPFLRNPLDYAKVSSVFNPSRRHPILNRIRAHKGVDYAASTGTPIKSTGDGRVAYKGRKGGYGQVVMIQHGNEYTTLYAHLSEFNESLNEGSEVKQGQVIGYVGRTGLATGPHLHYEFLVNGVHKDPLNVKLPHSLPINKALLSYFRTQTRPLLAQLEQAKTTMLARNAQQNLQEE